MEIKKFALGLRFDTLKCSVEQEDKDGFLAELCAAVPAKLAEGLELYAGFDGSPGVYTVVFMNGRLGRMRELYSVIDSDARIKARLEYRTPYVQNNVIRDYEGFVFLGRVDENGVTSEGCVSISFRGGESARPAADPKKTVLIAPNAFKGTISSEAASRMLALELRRRLPEYLPVPVPTADGGDGTLDAVERAMPVHRHTAVVTGPYGQRTQAAYLLSGGKKAVIESALASGLALCAGLPLDPLNATSRGTGELILRAAHEGAGELFVCLGGSATNDCGAGMANALGVRFLKADGTEAVSAAELAEVVSIDVSGLDPFVKKAHITVVCDVDSPLTGERGATYSFGPQKGADKNTLPVLERGMLNMERLLNSFAGCSVCSEPGSGAAGGMGAMLMALLGAARESGAEAVLKISDFDRKLKSAAFVITGEGRIDSTSLRGKATGAVLVHAHAAGVPAAVIAGSAGEGAEELLRLAAAVEYTGPADDPEARFGSAAKRLVGRIAELLR
ncbi:MAG: glycerate kinase [Clostridia bacterium]|nr:glycerate kinase [Clostridia bacterium]